MTQSLRIGIDGRSLVGKLSGTGRYIHELCRQLDIQMPTAEFFVYGPAEMSCPADNPRWHYRIDPLPMARRMKPVVWVKLRAGMLARGDKLDLFWGGTHFLPQFLPRSVRTVLTVHDLVYLLFPETMTGPHRYAHQWFFSRDFRRATRIVANSHGTSDRLQVAFQRPADAVVTPGVSESWQGSAAAEVDRTIAKLGVAPKFLLAVSTIEPRKNYRTLVNAFVSLRRSGQLPGYELVIVGGAGWMCDADLQLIKASAADGVRWLGFVEDADLRCLYSGTRLYICPSHYEGFGIPALEAVTCGAPALLADLPELREAGADAAHYIAMTEQNLQAAIVELLNGPPITSQPRQSPPRWSAGATTMKQVFYAAVGLKAP
jgi:glycosyltransferase involved in cell wall biosynthesis